MSEYTKEQMEDYLLKLKERFNEIDPNKYYLAYSGGRDSHFIFWFLREWLKVNDPDMYERYKAITIVSANTRMEHQDILKRMNDNADIIIIPDIKPFEYKEQIGIPCFTKMQDSIIRRYQKGNRSFATMRFIHGVDTSRFKLSTRAREALLNGKLHKVGDCCKALKKNPFIKFAEETGRHPIIGVRQSESLLRKVNYTSHIMKTGKLTPLFDLEEDLMVAIEKEYKIEVPDLYRVLRQTGCMGCPYGRNILDELKTLPKAKRDFTIALFKESYDIKGIKYQPLMEKEGEYTIDEIIADKEAREKEREERFKRKELIEETEEEYDEEEYDEDF